LTDAHGKEHQTATIQLDFQLPQRFELQYDAPGADGEDTTRQTPVLIHRAVLGSFERFLALLIEHYNGKYPFWMSPRPVLVASVSQQPEVLEYLEEVVNEISGIRPQNLVKKVPSQRPTIHVAKNSKPQSLGKKIRDAREQGYNFVLVVGPQDVKNRTVALQFSNQREADKSMEYLVQVDPSLAGPDSPGSGGSALTKGSNTTIQTNARTVKAFFENLQDEYM